jgi:hypothetical protein
MTTVVIKDILMLSVLSEPCRKLEDPKNLNLTRAVMNNKTAAEQVAKATLAFTAGQFDLEKDCMAQWVKDNGPNYKCGDVKKLRADVNKAFPMLKPSKISLCETSKNGFVFNHVYNEKCTGDSGFKRCDKIYPNSVSEIHKCQIENCQLKKFFLPGAYKSYIIWPRPSNTMQAAITFLKRSAECKDPTKCASKCQHPTQVCFPCAWRAEPTEVDACEYVGTWKDHYFGHDKSCPSDCKARLMYCHQRNEYLCSAKSIEEFDEAKKSMEQYQVEGAEENQPKYDTVDV